MGGKVVTLAQGWGIVPIALDIPDLAAHRHSFWHEWHANLHTPVVTDVVHILAHNDARLVEVCQGFAGFRGRTQLQEDCATSGRAVLPTPLCRCQYQPVRWLCCTTSARVLSQAVARVNSHTVTYVWRRTLHHRDA